MPVAMPWVLGEILEKIRPDYWPRNMQYHWKNQESQKQFNNNTKQYGWCQHSWQIC